MLTKWWGPFSGVCFRMNGTYPSLETGVFDYFLMYLLNIHSDFITQSRLIDRIKSYLELWLRRAVHWQNLSNFHHHNNNFLALCFGSYLCEIGNGHELPHDSGIRNCKMQIEVQLWSQTY